ncbi:MAG: TlpA family protein disulfide reductase [Bacteroidales bacterium]|nr:TlpA family protein disulfide reductase [Candidatus Colimorpha merdihippi]MCQ2282891.1 TlpA family protein disulfide reductase [Bacteroidales bacterium]
MKKFILSLVCMTIASIALAQNAQMPQNISIKALDGSTVQTSAIQNDGKPMIISFWATWCKPCNRELNTIKEVYEEWQEETGVKLVAISIDDARSANRVKPWVDGNGWEYEVYLDPNQDFKRAMNVVNVPHTFVINGKGEIIWQHTSFVEGSEEELLEIVKKAAAETDK